MKRKIAVSVLLLMILASVIALGPARAYVAAAADSIVTLATGSAANPSLAFEASKGTGLYYGGSNATVFTSNKVAKATIGATGLTMSAGANLALDTGTATATTGAATLNKQSGTITSESLTTTAGTSYTLTLTNSVVAATSRVFASVDNGTNTQGDPAITRVTPGSGQVVILVKNTHASQALNGTIKVNFFIVP